ncbi:substrate-binding domain-containing protein [Bosea sp. (in: a-proteobacteria)]|uniref:molybdate ABC transporter substrate-binding protein n=1 Tax=Bosea sp. (in: a-proteobacteria) TaxID=1871050 RepID=UPI0027323834|nr:substrate-binding domain-containing protein [Bosea sp. (in: a-proteobacteria)]MDP3406910.1 substrate-binding domain-containing protein [Bosea sp. (in: a-proteobacteria)]
MSTIVLLSGGAAQGLVKALAPAFEARTGMKVSAQFGAVGAMREKLSAGWPTDIVILTRDLIDDLARQGSVMAGSVADIGVVPTAIAIRRGEEGPDVTTAPALSAALRDAAEIHVPDLARSTAGIHFAGMLARLGLAESLASALRPHPNGATAMAALAATHAKPALGCTQATEIISQPGVELLGYLPDELSLETLYSAAICVNSSNRAQAEAFIADLFSPSAKGLRNSLGFSS